MLLRPRLPPGRQDLVAKGKANEEKLKSELAKAQSEPARAFRRRAWGAWGAWGAGAVFVFLFLLCFSLLFFPSFFFFFGGGGSVQVPEAQNTYPSSNKQMVGEYLAVSLWFSFTPTNHQLVGGLDWWFGLVVWWLN